METLRGKCEILLVDGGSTDGTLERIPAWIEVLKSPKGRAFQMNLGAEKSTGDILFSFTVTVSFHASAGPDPKGYAGSPCGMFRDRIPLMSFFYVYMPDNLQSPGKRPESHVWGSGDLYRQRAVF